MKIFDKVINFYDYFTIERPFLLLSLALLIISFFSLSIKDFKMDASADSLVLENDQALKYYRATSSRYSTEDFVVITFKPNDGIYNKKSLEMLDSLSKDLQDNIPDISSVLTILDVPLLNSPKIGFTDLAKEQRTLRTKNIDLELVKKEFATSPLYKNLLMSEDSTTTVLVVNFTKDNEYFKLLNQRNDLREIRLTRQLTESEKKSLKKAEKQFKDYSASHAIKEKKNIKKIRKVIEKYKSNASMFLGGVPMITSDMTDFIAQDVKKFGLGVFIFLVLILFIIFKSIRWIFIPLFGCIISVIFVSGLAGFIDWRITVISSNFAAILLIITMSMTIHLAVRYRELKAKDLNLTKKDAVSETIHYMFVPCVYTSLTTIVAFISLVVSGIRPVIDFGYLMTFGIISAFIITFIVFPTVLMLLPNESIFEKNDITKNITNKFANFSLNNYGKIILVATLISVVSIFGISKIKVENRFIDYFHSDTEIHQGMLEIDKKLGGTTPFDIIIDKPKLALDEKIIGEQDDDMEFDELSELFGEEDEIAGYWLSKPKFKEIEKIHDYLESQPETGKVLSLATLYKLAIGLNDDEPLSDLQIGAIKDSLSDEVKDVLFDPYLSEDETQTRITLRMIDSNENLNRKEFIERVENFLSSEMSYSSDRFNTTNMLVLYNNMLQSLFSSQIQTIGFVFISIMLMFIILFRSFYLALIAIIPNILPATLVLGFMGLKSIPLDLMTITIAAISVGIAVDNTIHYIIRFKREFYQNNNYSKSIQICHGSIGKAMYYTSSIIVIGFSILSLSNFIPTIYFGLLTGLAMLTALLASLTLLPSLLIIFKPLGKEK
jgi:predicted RND superfamily exporter protein|tara:strand:+ start:14250 stop:16751 length:2502 start_codon:yes stop_codon:yes gene_type:complete